MKVPGIPFLFVAALFLTSCYDARRSNCECSMTANRDVIESSMPSAEGMDSLTLVLAGELASELPQSYGMVVVRNGGVVFERYFNGKDANDSFAVRSVTKSVVGILTGLAIQNGFIDDEDVKIKAFFPEYFDTITDGQKRSITIRHLLTMSSGFQWNETADRLYGDYMQSAILLPMAAAPGSIFNYNSSNPHLISGILTKSTGQSTLEFASEHLFLPLGIRTSRWDRDPHDFCLGGTGLYLTLTDMAKIGFLYQNDGCYDGRSIVCRRWVEDSGEDAMGGDGVPYGYLWWLMMGGNHEVVYAYGYGGQMIYVVKDLKLVFAFTADPNVNAQTAQTTRSLADSLLINYIIPATEQNP